MPDLSIGHSPVERGLRLEGQTVVRIAIAVCFLALVVLAYARNVNWDEFHFLSLVYAFLDGSLDRPMQTFYVHGFSWLTWIPGNEVQQVFAARLVMIGFLVVTALSIHRIARVFTNQLSADIAVLAFLTSGFLLAHGGSFRADPMAAAFLTSSVAILMTTRMSALHIVSAAVLSALAVLVTIKSALFLPAYLAVLIWRKDEHGVLFRIVVSGVLAGLLCVLLYSWHASGIVVAEGKGTAANATEAANRTLLKSGLVPRSAEIVSWIVFSLAQLALITWGILDRRGARVKVVLVLFAMPLLTVVIYRNAFAYFFPFAIPLLMVAVAIGAQRIERSKYLPPLVAIMLISVAVQVILIWPEINRSQRATLAEVHRLFDEPVPYIDDSHMVSSFPGSGFLMSTWAVAKYNDRGIPIFADIVEKHRPPFLLTTKTALLRAMLPSLPASGRTKLLPEDEEVLRRSYVHYSGAIWLAGREVELNGEVSTVRLPFPGRYRVEATQPVVINGQTISDGMVIALEDALIALDGPAGAIVRLIWDTGVTPISKDSLSLRIYAGFQGLLL